MKKRTPHSKSAAGLRKRAEVRLRERGYAPNSEAGPQKSSVDAHRLLHELQVHQIELEMQNGELQEARERTEALLDEYTDLYDFAPVGYFSLACNGSIQRVNLTGARLVGVERSRLVGQILTRFLTGEDRASFRVFLAETFRGQTKQVCEVKLLDTGGQPRVVSIEADGTPKGRNCRAVVTEVTERKKAEAIQRQAEVLLAANEEANREIARRHAVETTLRETERTQAYLLAESRILHDQLRHLARQILNAQEQERRDISRELHDEVAQILAGVDVQLATLAQSATTDPVDVRKRIGIVRRLVGQSITIVHRFARKLRPTLLDDLGLIPALRAYIRDLPRRRGLQIDLTVPSEIEGLDADQRTVLYRVAQESLTNVVRHAHAHRVTVEISKTPRTVLLKVHDDGKSFPVERVLAPGASKRLGLLGMRERVEMVGGTLAIDSKPGQGTTVSAEIPIHKAERRPKS